MEDETTQLNVLLELETRHDDLLQRLDELDRRVERVLKECQPACSGAAMPDQRPATA